MPWQCEYELSVKSNLIYSDISLEALKDFDKEDKKLCFIYFLDVEPDWTLKS